MPLVSSIIGSNQTSRAVGAQVDWDKQGANKIGEATYAAQANMGNAVGQGNAALYNSYQQEQDNLAPYLQAGHQGINSISSMLQPGGELTKQFDFSPTDLQNDPGYQFQLQQGGKAVTNAQAAGGGAGSGSGAKALAQFNQGLAGTTYTNAYNRALTTFQTNRNNTLQPLEFLAGQGQTATGQYNSAAQNFGNQTSANDLYGATYSGNAGMSGAKSIADIFQNIGNAKAGGSLAQGNIWSQGINQSIAGALTGGAASAGGAGLWSSIGAGLGV